MTTPRTRKTPPVSEDLAATPDVAPAPKPVVMSTIEDGKKLKLRPLQWFQQRGVDLPGYLYRNGNTLTFQPQAFSIGDNDKGYLKQKFIEARYQVAGAEDFLAAPKAPEVYGISSEPDDVKALFYAAYLVQCYVERVPNARVKWLPLYKAVHDRDFFREPAPCDLLVVSGVYLNTIPFRLEIVRDLLSMYSHIPRLVTIGGTDALTMFKTQLHVELHKFAHFDSAAVRKTVEVV